MRSLTRWVLAHKRTVVAFWIVATIAGAAAGPASDALEAGVLGSRQGGLGDQPGDRRALPGHRRGHRPLVPVVTLPEGESVDSPASRASWRRSTRASPRRYRRPGSPPTLRPETTRSYPTTADDLRRDLSAARPELGLRREPRGRGGGERRARGRHGRRSARASDRLRRAGRGQRRRLEGPGVFLEALLGGFGALVVLTFVFASFLAIVPILMAIVSILTSFLLLLGLTEFATISPIVQFLIALLGLGVSIDYSLLVVSRWREAHGRRATRRSRSRWRPPGGRSSSAGSRSRSASSR